MPVFKKNIHYGKITRCIGTKKPSLQRTKVLRGENFERLLYSRVLPIVFSTLLLEHIMIRHRSDTLVD